MTTFYIPTDVDRTREPASGQSNRSSQPVNPVAAIRHMLSSLNLEQGDRVQAEVVRVRPNSTPPGDTTEPLRYRVDLKVGQHSFSVLTDKPIREQDLVRLLIKSDRQLQLLEVLPSRSTQLIQQTINAAVGEQRSLAPLLANLLSLQKQPLDLWLKMPAQQMSLPIADILFQKLPSILHQLSTTLPSKQLFLDPSALARFPDTESKSATTGSTLRTVTQHIGQLLEHHLNQIHKLLKQESINVDQSRSFLAKDLKGQLLNLQQLFQDLSVLLKAPTPQDGSTQRLQAFYSLLLYQSRFSTAGQKPTAPTASPASLAALASLTTTSATSATSPSSTQAASTPYPQPAPPLSGLPFFVKQPTAFSSLLEMTQSGTTAQHSSIDQLMMQLKGGLARLLLTQLNNLQNWPTNSDGSPRTFSFELPTQDQQQLHTTQIQIEKREIPHLQEEEQDESYDSLKVEIWNVTLNFDIDPLGPLFLKLSLQMPPGYRQQESDSQLAPIKAMAQIWAERESTASFTNQYTDLLKDMLTSIGLEVHQIKCQQGSMPQPKTNIEHHLVDLKT